MDTYKNDRIDISDDGAQLICTLKTRKHILALGFLTVWLIGWSIGGLVAMFLIFKEHFGPQTLFLFIWIIGWGIGWIIVFVTVMWGFRGKEIITVSPGQISHRYELFGIGKAKTFLTSNIEIFSIAPPSYAPFAPFIMRFLGQDMGGGLLWLKDNSVKEEPAKLYSFSFNPRNKSVFRMGEGLDIADAIKLARQIKERAAIQNEQTFGF